MTIRSLPQRRVGRYVRARFLQIRRQRRYRLRSQYRHPRLRAQAHRSHHRRPSPLSCPRLGTRFPVNRPQSRIGPCQISGMPLTRSDSERTATGCSLNHYNLSDPSARSVLPRCTSGLRASLKRFRYSWAAVSAALSLAIHFPSVILLWKEGRLLIAPALHGSGSFRGCSGLVLWSCSDSCRVGPNLSWRQEH